MATFGFNRKALRATQPKLHSMFMKIALSAVFSDEAHFDLGGYVNKQNCRPFRAQKNRKHTLKSRRTQNDSLFGADFGPEA